MNKSFKFKLSSRKSEVVYECKFNKTRALILWIDPHDGLAAATYIPTRKVKENLQEYKWEIVEGNQKKIYKYLGIEE